MKDLKTFTGAADKTITTLEVAEMMEVPHKEVLRKIDGGNDRKGYAEIIAGHQMVLSDYFYPSTYKDGSGKTNKCYLVTKMGCEFLANKFTGEKGIIFTARYVSRFNEMEQELVPKVPQTYKGALLEMVRLLDKNEKLEQQRLELETENTRMKPAQIFADAVSASDSSILIRDLAKIIRQNGVQVGEKRLYKWMRERGYICQYDTSPTQRAMELGLFETIYRTVDRGNGLPIETRTTKVTGKGQQYFINKFLNKDRMTG